MIYCLTVCLRLLHANLAAYLDQAEQSSSTSASGSIAKPISCAHNIRLLLLEMAIDMRSHFASSSKLRSSRPGIDETALVFLQGVACKVLITGMTVFYPTPQARVALLTELMRRERSSITAAADSSAVNASAFEVARKHSVMMDQVLEWFASQTQLVDTLLDLEYGNLAETQLQRKVSLETLSSWRKRTSADGAVPVSSKPPALISQPSASDVSDVSSFLAGLVQQCMVEDQLRQKQQPAADRSEPAEADELPPFLKSFGSRNAKPGAKDASTSFTGSLPPLSPSMRLLHAIQADLLISSQLVIDPSEVLKREQGRRNEEVSKLQDALRQQQQKAQAQSKKAPPQRSGSGSSSSVSLVQRLAAKRASSSALAAAVVQLKAKYDTSSSASAMSLAAAAAAAAANGDDPSSVLESMVIPDAEVLPVVKSKHGPEKYTNLLLTYVMSSIFCLCSIMSSLNDWWLACVATLASCSHCVSGSFAHGRSARSRRGAVPVHPANAAPLEYCSSPCYPSCRHWSRV